MVCEMAKLLFVDESEIAPCMQSLTCPTPRFTCGCNRCMTCLRLLALFSNIAACRPLPQQISLHADVLQALYVHTHCNTDASLVDAPAKCTSHSITQPLNHGQLQCVCDANVARTSNHATWTRNFKFHAHQICGLKRAVPDQTPRQVGDKALHSAQKLCLTSQDFAGPRCRLCLRQRSALLGSTVELGNRCGLVAGTPWSTPAYNQHIQPH